MDDEEKIKHTFCNEKEKEPFKIVKDAHLEHKFTIFVDRVINKDGRQFPSNYALRKISSRLQEMGISTDFIIRADDKEDISSTIKSFVIRELNNKINNVFVSLRKSQPEVWIDLKSGNFEMDQADFSAKLSSFTGKLNIISPVVRIINSENVPSRYLCLASVRILAPASLDRIEKYMAAKGFVIPSKEWLNHTLDAIRKSGNIYRQKNGEYTLTLSGLKRMGTAKNRRSPDVARALAIARWER